MCLDNELFQLDYCRRSRAKRTLGLCVANNQSGKRDITQAQPEQPALSGVPDQTNC